MSSASSQLVGPGSLQRHPAAAPALPPPVADLADTGDAALGVIKAVPEGVVMTVPEGAFSRPAQGVRPAVEGGRAGLPHTWTPLGSWEDRRGQILESRIDIWCLGSSDEI